jgi:pyruvate dehydrogenase E2 component (dihydrolipoamide acetyltransferase)
MATNVIMPALGVAQQTGTLLKWLKTEGQSVAKGEPLMEIETDKATVEIEAPGSGVLANVTASPGDEIPVGNRIAVILAPGETLGAAAASPPPSSLPKGEGTNEGRAVAQDKQAALKLPLATGEGRGEGQFEAVQLRGATPATPSTESRLNRLLASPLAKRIAREKGVDLASLKGSGPEGSIIAEDVLRARPDRALQTAADAHQIQSLTPMRRIVGERMAQSKQTAPHFYLAMDIDMSAVDKLRVEWKQHSEAKTPTINDFILYACSRALKDFPSINSSFGAQEIHLHADVHLGMAVALEEGLVVPVIRHADRLSLTELASQSRVLVDKAQSKKLFPLDYEGGTFTVSNLGALGVDSFVAIINPPQCAILAVGRVAQRVVRRHVCHQTLADGNALGGSSGRRRRHRSALSEADKRSFGTRKVLDLLE